MAPPVLKMKFITRFPANVLPDGPISLTKVGLSYTIGADYRPLIEELANVDTSSLIAGQKADGSFYKITVANLVANNQPLDPTLTALAALDSTAGLLEQNGADTFTKRALGTGASTSVPTLGDADGRYLALSSTTAFSRSLLDDADAATARTTLGLAIGTDVQAFDADLTSIAAISATNAIPYRSAANTWGTVTVGSGLSFTGGTLAVSGAGTGDVVGPASSVNNNIALFDGTTGKLLKDAAVGLLGAGRLKQISVGTHASATTTTSTSYAATSLQVSVTPQSTGNRILLFAMVPARSNEGSTASDGRARIQRSAPSANTEAEGPWGIAIGGATSVTMDGTMMLIGYATPASTALHTYVWEHRVVTSGDNFTSFIGNFTGYLVAMEITP